ncbi:MAG: TRAP transporter substrate-binding protein DctP [Proteobacteria bacterium]|nr:TRAP transporter substrate-binding protein DctP [Pseudomonadota bacterium]MBU4383908.1 TRAP transporter substrate-binding protein DctP [Pseudomonadota bacterium]MCG2763548.1 TRAP transporter substrate-binding protein DctP [Desulfarculaceae bacterium]
MKRTFLALGIIACLMIALPAFAAGDKPIRLKMTTFYMNKHSVYQYVYKKWIDEIKKRTNGRVIITYYNPNTIVPSSEVFDATIKGRIDIGGQLLSRNPGRFPLATVTSKVPTTISTLASSVACWELFKATPAIQAEFKGLKMFAMHQSAPTQLITKDVPVRKLEQIRGLRLACVSKDSILVARALGANPIMVPSAELYLALSRNMAEGVLYPIPPMRSFKIDEATKYVTFYELFSVPLWFGMNQAKWDSLPEDVKKVFEETTGDVFTEAIGRALDEGMERDAAIMKKEGLEYIYPSAEEKMRTAAILIPAMKAGWLEELGVANCTYADPDGLYNKAIELMKKNEKLYGRK